MKRECGTCTKCCEGYLPGVAHGKSFFNGKPCHFVSVGEKCTIYPTRPKDPCIDYKCMWLTNQDLPEWFKPDKINAIVDVRKIEGISYISLIEAGQPLKANVLTWVILYAINNNLNLRWMTDNGFHWIGSTEFLEAMAKNSNNQVQADQAK